MIEVRCANCARALDGPFCSSCGEKAVEIHRPLRELISQTIEETLNVDARLVRTLRPLLFKPGLVTSEYLSGHRVVHVPPLKVGWLFAYLPIALRRVHGGSRLITFFKLGGLGVMYLGVFWVGFMTVLLIGLSMV